MLISHFGESVAQFLKIGGDERKRFAQLQD